ARPTGRSDPLQFVRHLLVLGDRRVNTRIDLPVGRSPSDGGRPRLRPYGQGPHALLPARRQGGETVKPGTSGQGVRNGEAVPAGPEKDSLVPRTGGDPSACGETSPQVSAFADLDARPDGAVHDPRSAADRGAPEDAPGSLDTAGSILRQ